jgi:putative peptidoglycan lipid II flippase
VAAGILLSRIAGLVRQRALSHFLGLGAEADAFGAAFRIPNFLQNLFGEGALSASFIPVYSRRLGAGDTTGARRVAGAVAGGLGLLVGVLVLIGIAAAPGLVAVLAPGFTGDKRDLTIWLVRVLFPGAGLLVASAWCLGILNSHRRFFLPYTAPVLWNLVIIATVIAAGPRVGAPRLALLAALAAVAGSLLQFLVQLPSALRAAGPVRLVVLSQDPGAREVRRMFIPALLSRGVQQVGAWVDSMIASLLPTGAVAGLANAQLLYTLPVSLFGLSIAATELPEMAREAGQSPEPAEVLRTRLQDAMSRVAFFVVPSAVGFIGLGHLVATLVFQSGRFGPADSRFVWGILAGSSVGLLAATLSRLLASALYALGDARTPFRLAALRVALAASTGYLAAMSLPGLVGVDQRWGVAGLTVASGLAGWVEFLLLRRALGARVGTVRLPASLLPRLWGAAIGSLAIVWGGLILVPSWAAWLQALLALGLYGLIYLSAVTWLGVPGAREFVLKVLRRVH